MPKTTASIVIYKENPNILKKTLESLMSLDLKLIVVDNSPTTYLSKLCLSYENLIYIKTEKNIGFGAGHNLAFKKVKSNFSTHMIVNPDAYFEPKHIKEFLAWFKEEKNISLATPKVCNTDGSTQHIVRSIPTPISLLKRRLGIESGELHVEDKSIVNIPFAHGCFLVFKSDVYEKLGGFDEKFFMYMEDLDICIRAKNFGRVVMNSNFEVYHEYRKGSSKSLKLLFFHTVSAFKFFLSSTYFKKNNF